MTFGTEDNNLDSYFGGTPNNSGGIDDPFSGIIRKLWVA